MLRILLFILAGAFLAGAEPASGQQRETSGTRFAQVEGRKVRVQTLGLERRQAGAPVIVLESGVATPLDGWRGILPELAKLAPVVAYDRAGIGQSDWDGASPDPRHAASRLRRILAELGVAPPYVIVGHSWGGVLARYFAGMHAKEVAGLVLLDPGPTLSGAPEGHLAPFRAIGAGEKEFDVYWSTFTGLFGKASPAVQAEFRSMRQLLEMAPAQRQMPALPDMPVAVIVAGKYLHLPIYEQMPLDSRRFFEADLSHRVEVLQQLVRGSSNGTLLLATEASHAVHKDAPGLVVWAVRRVLEAQPPTR